MVLISLNSCVPMIVGTGVAIGGKVMMQDKTFGEAISDNTIWTKIHAGFVREKVDSLLGGINISVSEGRVLLTGFIDKPEDVVRVLKVVWAQDGVKEVINEIKVKNKENSPSGLDYAKDSWTTTQIKTKLLFGSDIKSGNFSVETINSVVYLFGIAKSEEELASVKDIASSASNAKKIVCYIRVRKNLESRIEDTKGEKPSVSKQEALDAESLEEEVVDTGEGEEVVDTGEEDDIFDTKNF